MNKRKNKNSNNLEVKRLSKHSFDNLNSASNKEKVLGILNIIIINQNNIKKIYS